MSWSLASILPILAGTVEVTFGLVDAGGQQRGAHGFEVDAVALQLRGVDLDADRRLLAAADADQADAVDLRNLGREARVDQVFHLRQRHGF